LRLDVVALLHDKLIDLDQFFLIAIVEFELLFSLQEGRYLIVICFDERNDACIFFLLEQRVEQIETDAGGVLVGCHVEEEGLLDFIAADAVEFRIHLQHLLVVVHHD
jgi:hypothetical protein